MSRSDKRKSVESAKAGIVFHAKKCEEALRLSAFADSQTVFYSTGMGEGLRKLAAYHSEQAWAWVNSLARSGAVA